MLKLPPWIDFEGINFEFQLINNGGNEMRLVYAIASVAPDSPHRAVYDDHGSWLNKLVNPTEPPMQGFLILYENIDTDVDLCWAVRDCWFRLWEMGIMTVKKDPDETA